MTQADISQREAARYLLSVRRASQTFGGFLDYLYPDFKRPSFQEEYVEVLNLLEKDALVSAGGNPIRKVLVNMPPRHAKSFLGTTNFPAYVLARKPHREVMVSAYNNDLATTFGRGTRELVTDKRVTKAFSKFELSKETRAVDFWKTTDGGAYYAVGLDGTTTGRGANFLDVDDPYKSREEAESLTTRRRVWNFYISGLLSRRQPDRDGQLPFQVVTHTRWHPDDLAGRIMEQPDFKRGEWMHLNFEALTTKGRVYISRSNLPEDSPEYVPTTADGEKDFGHDRLNRSERAVLAPQEYEALWPDRFPVSSLLATREELGEREFSALYQQKPYIVGGNLLKEPWFQRYKADEAPTSFSALVFTLDTAFKTKTVHDYSVATLGGVTESGDIYVLKVWREKMEFPELKRHIVGLNAAYRGKGLRGFYIEDAASGQALIQELKNGSGIPVIAWKPGTSDKLNRASSITPLLEAGRVFIPEESDWLADWIDEIVTFPASRNDDQVDSFVMLVDVLSRMTVSGNRAWDQPIGNFLVEPSLKEVQSPFAGQPLGIDPSGWLGRGGFGNVAQQMGSGWSGWGE